MWFAFKEKVNCGPLYSVQRYLDVSTGVDFVHGVPWGPACLSVQVVTLDKHSVVTEASHPHVPLALALQLNPFANVKPKGGENRVARTGQNLRMTLKMLDFSQKAQNDEGTWVAYLALSMASVRCTLLSWPKQNLSPPEGSTYPSTVTMGQEEGTLNVSPTWTSISKQAMEHQQSGAETDTHD